MVSCVLFSGAPIAAACSQAMVAESVERAAAAGRVVISMMHRFRHPGKSEKANAPGCCRAPTGLATTGRSIV
jgi:hypothetical protein